MPTPTDGDDDGPGDAERDSSPHLDGIPDGAGCTEIWEELSAQRTDADAD